MERNRLLSRVVPNLQEKRYYTLNLIESAVAHGSEVVINTVKKKELTALSSEEFTYNDDNLDTYIIFDERPKINLLKTLGWFREDGEAPILAYIPTHFLFKITEENSEEIATIDNYKVISGDPFKEIVHNGETNDKKYKLKPVIITRGTLIDIKYDFLPKVIINGELKDDPRGTTNRFFVTDVKVDPVSLNYIANLMPYRYSVEKRDIKDEEGNIVNRNQSYINFDTEKYGM